MADKKTANTKPLIITLAIIIGVIAIIIIATRLSKPNYDEYTYNNYPFEPSDTLWITWAEKDGQPYRIPFYHHPTELEDIVAEPGLEQLLLFASKEKPETVVYITLDPELQSRAVVAAVEISRLTGDRYNLLNLETHGALTRLPDEQIANTQNPIITCNDANHDTIVIWMTLTNANFIHAEGNCITLEARSDEDMVRVADRFAYMIIGIMK
ncbi:hypothetical protein ACFL1B_03575 [Nanoarchaeota archaeon]